MLFDNVTLKKGMDFAAQLCAVHRQLSPIDLRDILLGCFSGLPIAGKNQCDHIRKNIVSVSYTHLDVYKRQAYAAADEQDVAVPVHDADS